MKQAMKRFGAMLLTMAMLLSLAVTGVSAEGTESTTPSAAGGQTVNITFDGLGEDTLTGYQVIKYNDAYNAFEDADNLDNKTSFWEYLDSQKGNNYPNAAEFLASKSNSDALRTFLQEFLTTNNTGLPAIPAFAATNNNQVTGVKPGYYILRVDSPSKIYNTMLLFVGYQNGELVVQTNNSNLTKDGDGAYKATVKSEDGPKVEKKVFDDRSDATNDQLKNKENWKTAAASEVGQEVRFAVKVTLPTYQNDAVVNLTLKDTLTNLKYIGGAFSATDGSTFNGVEVYKANGDKVANAVKSVDPGTYNNGSQTMEIKLNYDVLKAANATNGEFYVYYKAILTKDAVSTAQNGTNAVTLDYTVETSSSKYHKVTNPATTIVYTYNFKLEKEYNGADNISSTAAKFSVYAGLNDDGNDVDTNKMLTFKLADGGYYYPSNETDAVKSIPANFEIRGLDVNTPYYVKEVETAPGYYLPTSYFTLQLSGAEKEGDETHLLTGDLKYENTNDYSQPSSFVAKKEVDQALVQNGHDGDYKYGEIGTGKADNATKQYQYYVKLNNTNTPVLPSTGGMGTTLFTVGGVALLALAAAMLILRRRKN